MGSLSEEIEHQFRQDFPRRLGEDTLRVLFNGYPHAAKSVSQQYLEPEAHDLRAVMRRGVIEQDWRSIAGRVPGVVATAEPTDGGRSYYTRVRAKRIVLTQSSVASPGAIPRRAEFRVDHSRRAQGDFFVSGDHDRDDELLYGIVLHGETPRERSSLGFAYVAFPDAGCETWLHKIDLFEEYGDFIRRLRGEPEPDAPRSPLRLRDQPVKA